MGLYVLGEGGVEIIEVDLLKVSRIVEERVPELLSDKFRKYRAIEPLPDALRQRLGNQLVVSGSILQIEERGTVPHVSAKNFVTAFPGQHHFHLLASELRSKMQRDARGPDNGLVFVPDQLRQVSKKVLRSKEDL